MVERVVDLAAMREQYSRAGLSRGDLAQDPVEQFQAWFDEWRSSGPYDANAFIVATVGEDGWPSARAVLLKGLDQRGFVFHTNRRSAKGLDLEANSRAALCFLWHPLERQVRVVGTAEHLPNDESDAYFASRPRGAQIGAWASPQSAVIGERADLERLTSAAEARFSEAPQAGQAPKPKPGGVPRPAHWGGYLVRPLSVEFWQGRRSRLHDRLRYRRPAAEAGLPTGRSNWTVERLAP